MAKKKPNNDNWVLKCFGLRFIRSVAAYLLAVVFITGLLMAGVEMSVEVAIASVGILSAGMLGADKIHRAFKE